jgi:hypothetical protein
MVEHFADLTSVEPEMCVSEMDKRNACDKNQHPGVISLALGLKRIVA